MGAWIVWFVLAGVVVILEIFTGTFYLLMIALGLLAGGIAALAGTADWIQLTAAAVVGVAATYALRRKRIGIAPTVDAARDPNVNLDIGQSIAIESWRQPEGGIPSARATYRGAMWDVELASGAVARPGTFVIVEIRGNRLVVSNSQ